MVTVSPVDNVAGHFRAVSLGAVSLGCVSLGAMSLGGAVPLRAVPLGAVSLGAVPAGFRVGGPPLISRGAARQLAHRELAKPAYHQRVAILCGDDYDS